MINDKSCIQQVLGGLIKHPQFLSEIDKYYFSLEDFSSSFEKVIFIAINGLYSKGATSINPIDIYNYIEVDSSSKRIFEKNNGIEYIQDIMEFVDLDNFPYYYNKLKKINLVKDLQKHGFNTSDIYCEDLLNKKADEINSHFEQLETKDIIDIIKKKLINIESVYAQSEEIKCENAADGIEDLINFMAEKTMIGKPLQGRIYNTIFGGAQPSTLTIRSAPSGVGKTRLAVGEACGLAYPITYNRQKGKWENTGSCEKVLYIATEQSVEQIKRLIVSYISDIDSDVLRYGRATKAEKQILKQTAWLMNEYKDNFIILQIPDPSIEIVKHMLREKVLLNNVKYVFYDYIFISNALLAEYKFSSLRNDELLLLFTTALKQLADELNIYISTSTQVNAKADDNKDIRNEAALAGGRSTINKADNGCIMARPTKEELEVLAPFKKEFGYEPNLVTDIFKCRDGRWTQVRIWSYVNLGRMKKKDLFLTDSRLNLINDIFDAPMVEFDEDLETSNKIKESLRYLNEQLPRNNRQLRSGSSNTANEKIGCDKNDRNGNIFDLSNYLSQR